MQRTSRHRGADPEDERSFGAGRLEALRQASDDLCWLLDRGYGISSATELVGDRYHFTRRQRIAVARCACSRADKERRRSRCVGLAQLRGQGLWLDGLNVLTIIESALGAAWCSLERWLLPGRGRRLFALPQGGGNRSGTSSHRRSRFAIGVTQCRWWLDSPVDNSGR